MGIWLGIFPTVETIAAQLAGGAFVIGSYVLAEQLKNRRRSAVLRRQAQPKPHRNGAGEGVDGPAPARPADSGDRAIEQPRV
jgi:high-affinity iron transporter